MASALAPLLLRSTNHPHSGRHLIHYFHRPFNANLLYMIFQPFSFRKCCTEFSERGRVSAKHFRYHLSPQCHFSYFAGRLKCRNHFTSYKVVGRLSRPTECCTNFSHIFVADVDAWTALSLNCAAISETQLFGVGFGTEFHRAQCRTDCSP